MADNNESIIMEYPVYLEQKYTNDGTIKVQILSAAEAAARGYEDGYHNKSAETALYVDGFNSEASARNYILNMNGEILEQK